MARDEAVDDVADDEGRIATMPRYTAPNSDLVDHLLDEVGGGLTRAEAGDEAAVLLQVVGDLNGVELDGGIEVAEGDDHQEVDDHVEYALAVHRLVQEAPEGTLLGAGKRATVAGR